jgi:ribose/xylose/arabinose/galactoside ABC-type transport system permease subunit
MQTGEVKSTTKRFNLKDKRWLNFIGEQGFIIIFILWAVFLSFATSVFLTTGNILTVLRQAAIISILAIGEHFIVLLGTMDISVASALSLTGVAMGALLVNFGLHPLLAAPLVMAIGALVGLVNGSIVTRLKINPIITTLGMMGILEGLAFIYTKGKTIYGNPIDAIGFLGSGRVVGIPVPVLIMFLLYALAFLVFRYTRFGAYIFATGNNEKAAWLAGINVQAVKRNAFIVSGILAACGGIMQVARQGSATGGMGADFLFPVITAVVLGGTSLSGGRGKILNTLIAAVFLTTITNGMVLLGVSIYTQRIIQGAILILALSLDQLRSVQA